MENCTIKCRVEWFAGGHNHKPVRIKDCIFEEYFSVEDCWFDEEVVLERVQFLKGTDIAGKTNETVWLQEATFDNGLVLINVTGHE